MLHAWDLVKAILAGDDFVGVGNLPENSAAAESESGFAQTFIHPLYRTPFRLPSSAQRPHSYRLGGLPVTTATAPIDTTLQLIDDLKFHHCESHTHRADMLDALGQLDGERTLPNNVAKHRPPPGSNASSTCRPLPPTSTPVSPGDFAGSASSLRRFGPT